MRLSFGRALYETARALRRVRRAKLLRFAKFDEDKDAERKFPGSKVFPDISVGSRTYEIRYVPMQVLSVDVSTLELPETLLRPSSRLWCINSRELASPNVHYAHPQMHDAA